MKQIFNVPVNLAIGHREYRGLENREFVEVVGRDLDPGVFDSTKVLFDKIFAVNPVTNLPDGDIAVFMSENTSPEIKAFIQSQLMSPNGQKSDTSYDGLSDDDLSVLSRGADESLTAYASRMRSVIYQQVKAEKAKQSKSD